MLESCFSSAHIKWPACRYCSIAFPLPYLELRICQSLPPLPYTGPGAGTMEGCVLMLILCCYNRFEKNKIKPYPHIKSPRLSGKSLTDFLLLDFFFTILQLLLPYWHLVKINSENNFPKLKNIYIEDWWRGEKITPIPCKQRKINTRYGYQIKKCNKLVLEG